MQKEGNMALKDGGGIGIGGGLKKGADL